ncbi:MAG: MFS transporter [Pyrinomonadaceae bacterium]
MHSLTYGELIRGNRNFRNLLAGQFISELGNWFNFIAGLGLVRVVSDASPTAAGLFFVARLIPFALTSPIAGTFVDRFSRRQVMIWTDIFRFAIALSFLLVNEPGELWIAYLATVLLHFFGAFFDGAKNAAAPNLTGKEGLLAGTALLFSTRFLLMAIGSALGGWAAAAFGYKAAFIINAVSFLISAYTVWLIPEEATRDGETGARMRKFGRRAQSGAEENHHVGSEQPTPLVPAAEAASVAVGPQPRKEGSEERPSFMTELREGLSYTVKNHFALTILIMNVIWATGGGSINVIFERIGGVYFAGTEGWNPDVAVAMLWTATGFGLTLGMLIARRTSMYLDKKGRNHGFIGWTLIVHGVLFSLAAFMPTLWLFSVIVFVSRAIVGVEYAVQETMFQRSLPDYIRGRISTLDRGAELTMFGLSSYVASGMMYYITPQTLTIISGVLSALAGIVWFLREKKAEPDSIAT